MAQLQPASKPNHPLIDTEMTVFHTHFHALPSIWHYSIYQMSILKNPFPNLQHDPETSSNHSSNHRKNFQLQVAIPRLSLVHWATRQAPGRQLAPLPPASPLGWALGWPPECATRSGRILTIFLWNNKVETSQFGPKPLYGFHWFLMSALIHNFFFCIYVWELQKKSCFVVFRGPCSAKVRGKHNQTNPWDSSRENSWKYN